MHMKHSALLAGLALVGLLCLGAGTKTKGLVITFHLEGEESDSEKFVTPVKLGSEHRQYFFRKMPAFTSADLLWFYPFVAQDGQSFGAAFRLKDHKAQELTGLTTANQGQLFGTRIVGGPMSAVVIDRPINDGVLVMWEGLAQQHLQFINSQVPHVDQVGSPDAVPSFNLPQQSQVPGPGGAVAGGGAPKKKPFGKFFENVGRKKETPAATNPYVNPPRP